MSFRSVGISTPEFRGAGYVMRIERVRAVTKDQIDAVWAHRTAHARCTLWKQRYRPATSPATRVGDRACVNLYAPFARSPGNLYESENEV